VRNDLTGLQLAGSKTRPRRNHPQSSELRQPLDNYDGCIDFACLHRNTPTAMIAFTRVMTRARSLLMGNSCVPVPSACGYPFPAVIDAPELVPCNNPVVQLACIEPVILFPCLLSFADHTPPLRYPSVSAERTTQSPRFPSSKACKLSAQPLSQVQNDVRFGLDHAFPQRIFRQHPDGRSKYCSLCPSIRYMEF